MTPDQLVEFAEALARVAASGGGAKAFASLVAERTGAGVLIEDAEWRALATAGRGTLPPTARNLNGGRAKTVSIAAGETRFGYLSLFPAEPATNDESLPLLRLAASALAVELARESGGAQGRKRAFWDRLIAREYADAGAAREDAAARGIVLAPHYLCLAVEAEGKSDDRSSRAELRTLVTDTFRSADADVATLERGAALLVLVPAAREVDAENARTAAHLLPKTAQKRKVGIGLCGGVSALVPLNDVGTGVAQAESALAIVRRIFGGGRVVSYDDLGAYPLLYSGAGVETLRAFAERTLAPLRAYDEKHQTELERTLRLYFSTGQNVKDAAAELNVHRHTVFYRLRQISEISGRTLESAHDQLTLRLAIAIDALHT